MSDVPDVTHLKAAYLEWCDYPPSESGPNFDRAIDAIKREAAAEALERFADKPKFVSVMGKADVSHMCRALYITARRIREEGTKWSG